MLQKIKNNSELRPYLHTRLEDAGLEVKVAESVREDEYAAIKVDDYYAGLRLGKQTPKSVDFIAVVDNGNAWYNLYVLEFKNCKRPRGLRFGDIREKFETALNNFLSHRFSEIFLSETYHYSDICIALVSDAYLRSKGYPFEEYRTHLQDTGKDSLSIENQLLQKPILFQNRLYQIKFFESNGIQICKSYISKEQTDIVPLK